MPDSRKGLAQLGRERKEVNMKFLIIWTRNTAQRGSDRDEFIIDFGGKVEEDSRMLKLDECRRIIILHGSEGKIVTNWMGYRDAKKVGQILAALVIDTLKDVLTQEVEIMFCFHPPANFGSKQFADSLHESLHIQLKERLKKVRVEEYHGDIFVPLRSEIIGFLNDLTPDKFDKLWDSPHSDWTRGDWTNS